MRSVARLAVVAAIVTGVRVAGQNPAPDQAQTFRTRTDIVRLDVSVLDAQRIPVRGLSAEDFTVLENGVSQPIVAFSEVEVPVWPEGKAGWLREVAPDVATNRFDARRAVVIVMDDYLTPRDPGAAKSARTIANETIDRLGPADVAAVVYIVNRKAGQEFTVDRALLRAAVTRFDPAGVLGTPEGHFTAGAPNQGLVMPSRRATVESGACNDRCIRAALQNIGEILEPWSGARKSVVFISPGRQLSNVNDLDRLSEQDDLGRILSTFQRANANIYQYDPRGLQVDRQISYDFGTLSELTGGRAIADTNAPEALVPQMFRENSSYYLLGFRIGNPADGRFRRITVKVNRPDVDVRTRAGYYPPKDRPPVTPAAAVDRALAGGLPTGDLPLSVNVLPFSIIEKPGATIAVVARVEPPRDVPPGSVVELTALAFDDKWKQVASVTLPFMLPEPPDPRHTPEVGARLDLAPGRYEVRTAVRSVATGSTGSAYASVTVPDFSRAPLALSGLVVERSSGGAAMPQNIASVVPARPTTERDFAVGDHVAIATRVSQGRGNLARVTISTQIVDEANRTVFEKRATVEASAFEGRRQADYRLELPLEQLAGGEHLVRLEATSGKNSARRELRFSVRK